MRHAAFQMVTKPRSARPSVEARARDLARAVLFGLVLLPLIAGLHAEYGRERMATAADHKAEIEAAMRAVLTPDHVEQALARDFAAGDIESAGLLIEAADMVATPVAPHWRARYLTETTGWRSAARSAWRCGRGFVTGEGASTAEITCAIGSDLMVVGDVRDVGREVAHFAGGNEVDTVMLGLAGAGIALTAAVPASGGVSLAARTGVALMKAALRSGIAGAGLVTSIGKAVVGTKAVAGTLSAPAMRRASVRGAVDLKRLAPLRDAASNLGHVWHAGGARSVTAAIRTAGSLDDLRHSSKIAQMFGKRTAAVYRTVGPKAFRIVKTATRWTAKGILLLSGLALSAVSAVVSLAVSARIVLGALALAARPAIRLTARAFDTLALAITNQAAAMLPART